MPPAASVSRDMQGTKSRHDIIAGLGPKDIWAGLELAYRQ